MLFHSFCRLLSTRVQLRRGLQSRPAVFPGHVIYINHPIS